MLIFRFRDRRPPEPGTPVLYLPPEPCPIPVSPSESLCDRPHCTSESDTTSASLAVLTTAVLAVLTFSSTKVFHSLQAGHCPSHFDSSCPQFWQKNTLFFALAIMLLPRRYLIGVCSFAKGSDPYETPMKKRQVYVSLSPFLLLYADDSSTNTLIH